ncbi:helix-turn-helix domain-containing protein [Cryptosporangium sp. NPDC048952]|uniref:helix-turn-helix domain-containing protein n=1 Tax=Cryptosporangium sp. NPDC048952 TaxID=3363961 RepID=UPI0037167F1D
MTTSVPVAVRAARMPAAVALKKLRIIDDRLADGYGSPPSLNELAQLCGLSSRHLTRGFRVSRGCSLGHYAARLCMEKAMGLLSKDEKVYKVAAALGYTTASGFSDAFRKQCGCTPGEFRRAAL